MRGKKELLILSSHHSLPARLLSVQYEITINAEMFSSAYFCSLVFFFCFTREFFLKVVFLVLKLIYYICLGKVRTISITTLTITFSGWQYYYFFFLFFLLPLVFLQNLQYVYIISLLEFGFKNNIWSNQGSSCAILVSLSPIFNTVSDTE